MIIKPIPKLHEAPQPPLLYPGAVADSDRAKKPRLSEPSATDQELAPGDRVEALGNFGKPTGEFGTVEQAHIERQGRSLHIQRRVIVAVDDFAKADLLS